MQVYTQEALEKVVVPEEFDAFLENALRTFQPESLVQARREVIRLDDSSLWLIMPVVDLSSDSVLIKMVSEYKRNPERGLPKATGITQLIRASDGTLLGLFDSHFLTGLRTASLAAIATKFLAKKDCTTLGVIGSGYEARLITEGVLRVRAGIDTIRVYSRNRERRHEFAKRFSTRALAVPVETASDASRGADILVLATDSLTPVIEGESVSPGTHVVSIGTLPERRELDRATLAKSKVVVADKPEAVLAEAGDIADAVSSGVIKKELIVDIVDLIKGHTKVERGDEDITVYKSVGFAYLDLAAALYIRNKLGASS